MDDSKKAVALRLEVSSENLPSIPPRYNDLIEQFVNAMDVGERSRVSYRANIKRFFEWVHLNQVNTFDRNTILEYKRYLQAKELSAFTVSAYLTAVRLFFEWAETLKLYPNVAKGIKGGKKPQGHQKDALTKEQAVTLFTSIDQSSIQGKRDFALLSLLARTGLRTIEIIRANVDDIRNINGKTVLFVQGKGRDAKDEPIVLTGGTEKPIRAYLAARGELKSNAPLFPSLSKKNMGERLTTRSVSRVVKEALKMIGINSPRITAHSLRHTAISLVLEGGGTLLQAQSLGRHRNIATTMVYLHQKDRLNNTPEEIIEKLFEENG